MRLAAAIALAFLYAGVTLAWGGVHPRGGPWWIFAPFIVIAGAGLLAEFVSSTLPKPWSEGRRYGQPPRRVHLSWRQVFRVPALAPLLVFLYYVYWSLSLHFDIGWVAYVVATLVALAVVFVARGRRREIRLLRDGEVALGTIDRRSDIGEGADRLAFHFTTGDGRIVASRGWDVGYGVKTGSAVPVFHDAGDPRDHVIACGCWFEAE